MARAPDGSAMELYKQANECFVSEDYDRSIQLYTASINQDPTVIQCYAAKAQAFIKTEKYELAKQEANRGIDFMRQMMKSNANSSADRLPDLDKEWKKCLQRSGVSSFYLGQYAQAKKNFTTAYECDKSDKGVSQWLVWCDEKIKKFGSGETETKTTSAVPTEENTPSPAPNNTATSPANATTQSSTDTNVTPAKDAMPVPKIKYDWYQTETHVIVEVRIKGLKSEDVSVDFHDASLSVTAKLVVGSDYSLEIDLAHPIVPDQSTYKIMSTKLEIKMRKKEAVRWAALEGDGSAPVAGASLPPSNTGLKAPYTSGRDWNKVEKALEKEIDEKKEGEAALNEMFQKIYSDASDDVKKAMNKSFQESGGTVLSTNWSEIGKEKVDVKPPDGMEYRKWD